MSLFSSARERTLRIHSYSREDCAQTNWRVNRYSKRIWWKQMDFCNEHLKKTLRWSGSTLKNTNTLVFPVPLFCVFFFFFRWASLYLWLCLLGLLEPMTSITGSYASATGPQHYWVCGVQSLVRSNRYVHLTGHWHLLCFLQKRKGIFHHSSFLAGGATLAAGRFIAENGVLKVLYMGVKLRRQAYVMYFVHSF